MKTEKYKGRKIFFNETDRGIYVNVKGANHVFGPFETKKQGLDIIKEEIQRGYC